MLQIFYEMSKLPKHVRRRVIWEFQFKLNKGANNKMLTNTVRNLKTKLRDLNLRCNKLYYPYSAWDLSAINFFLENYKNKMILVTFSTMGIYVHRPLGL